VLIVAYPDGLPVNGSNCWPLVHPNRAGEQTMVNQVLAQLS
jgi:hypothetical protein